jgi:hypothetical protein
MSLKQHVFNKIGVSSFAVFRGLLIAVKGVWISIN